MEEMPRKTVHKTKHKCIKSEIMQTVQTSLESSAQIK